MTINIGIDTGGTFTDAVVYDTIAKRVLAKAKARTTKENLAFGIAEALGGLPKRYFAGGTFTDAVVYDTIAKRVLAKAKARTTKENLAFGIAEALGGLPKRYFGQARLLVLSTTLATNACVENKGSRSKLVLIGTNESVLRRINASAKYGIRDEAVLCIPTQETLADGTVGVPPWDEIIASNEDWFADADALAICERNAINNGAVCEHEAERILSDRINVPIVKACDLAKHLNMMERGATALLNARLLPVIEDFVHAVDQCLEHRATTTPPMILRSDGGIMQASLSKSRPVETILSGPAASVQGARELSDQTSCMVVDMGGTTTDLALIDSGKPQMDGKTHIGSWRTQVEGVRVDTFSLGGDTRIVFKDGRLDLSTRRVEPISSAAQKYPELLRKLRELADRPIKTQLPLFEALYLIRTPSEEKALSGSESAIIETLRKGPVLLDQVDLFALNVEKLESEGYVMRCGFTPTDAMHVKGDFSCYESEAAILCARYIAEALPSCPDGFDGATRVCNMVYDLVEHNLFVGILSSLITRRYPSLADDESAETLERLVELQWENARDTVSGKSYFSLVPEIDIPLVGLGAPTHIFLPPVARDLGAVWMIPDHAEVANPLVGLGAPTHIFLPPVARDLGAVWMIPDHAEVANAVGAAAAHVSATSAVAVMPVYDSFGITGYTVHSRRCVDRFATRKEAIDTAKSHARQEAAHDAVDRGASNEVEVLIDITENTTSAGDGQVLDLGTTTTSAGDGQVLDLGTTVTARIDCTIA